MEAKRATDIERALRRGALAGDEAAWRTLYDRAFSPLAVFVRRRCCRDPAEADEALQECWLVAVRRLESFDPDRGSFLSWLLGIAVNVLRNRGRSRARRAVKAGLSELADGAVGPVPDPDSAEEIAVAMAALDRRHRAVLRLKYEEQLTVREIAARWEASAKAVESLLSRARAGDCYLAAAEADPLAAVRCYARLLEEDADTTTKSDDSWLLLYLKLARP